MLESNVKDVVTGHLSNRSRIIKKQGDFCLIKSHLPNTVIIKLYEDGVNWVDNGKPKML